MKKNNPIKSLVIDEAHWHKYSKTILRVFLLSPLILIFVPWMQAVNGEGRIIALDPQERRQELSSPIDGRIQKWFVGEGQVVKKGDPIVQLTDNDPLILDRMNKEREAIEKKFESIEMARKTAAINVQRQKQLFKEGLSSQRQYEMARMELAKLESDEASALADISRIDVRLSRQEQQMIESPMDGTVVSVLKTSAAGADYVKAGEPLAILVPNTLSRAVEIWVSGNDMPWITNGNRVAMQFEGWPSIFFSGVPDASVGTFFGKVHVVDALDDGHGNFRILVVPESNESWPPSGYLKQGVRAHAWVLLGDVPLGYELWRRFNGFPPSNLPVYKKAKNDKAESKKETQTKEDK